MPQTWLWFGTRQLLFLCLGVRKEWSLRCGLCPYPSALAFRIKRCNQANILLVPHLVINQHTSFSNSSPLQAESAIGLEILVREDHW
jgi:hypothetical protein